MKIIVGLGNPDREYLNTFHNLGFMSVEKSAKLAGVEFTKEKCRGLIAETKINGEKVLFVKPLTYMNLSGECIREVMSFFKAELSDLIVIYDDYDLIKGSIRIRENGSSGTHNGMRNIVKVLGSENFARIRVGFKPTESTQIPLIDYVLSGIKGDDVQLFDEMTTIAGRAAFEFAKGEPIQKVMQKYNIIVK